MAGYFTRDSGNPAATPPAHATPCGTRTNAVRAVVARPRGHSRNLQPGAVALPWLITCGIGPFTIATPVFQQGLEQTMAELGCLLCGVLFSEEKTRFVYKTVPNEPPVNLQLQTPLETAL